MEVFIKHDLINNTNLDELDIRDMSVEQTLFHFSKPQCLFETWGLLLSSPDYPRRQIKTGINSKPPCIQENTVLRYNKVRVNVLIVTQICSPCSSFAVSDGSV